MKAIALALVALSLAVLPAAAQEVTEPSSGVRFARRDSCHGPPP
jgi:hypothetical protein